MWNSSEKAQADQGVAGPRDVGRHGLHKCLRLPHRVLGVALTDTGPAQAASVVFPPLDELFNKLGLDPIMAPAAGRLWGDEARLQ